MRTSSDLYAADIFVELTFRKEELNPRFHFSFLLWISNKINSRTWQHSVQPDCWRKKLPNFEGRKCVPESGQIFLLVLEQKIERQLDSNVDQI